MSSAATDAQLQLVVLLQVLCYVSNPFGLRMPNALRHAVLPLHLFCTYHEDPLKNSAEVPQIEQVVALGRGGQQLLTDLQAASTMTQDLTEHIKMEVLVSLLSQACMQALFWRAAN